MTVRYVGSGGSDASNGTSWATRKLTLNGVEDTPVVAGDTIYIGPGTYREMLTCDVTGSAGNIITYIADVTGVHTDGIGGMVRLTGSDNDTTATRNRCVYIATRSYRTFQGFTMDMCTEAPFKTYGASSYITIQDCFATNPGGGYAVSFEGTGTNCTAKRCLLSTDSDGVCIRWYDASVQSDLAGVCENCIMIGGYANVYIQRTGGITFRNCLFVGAAEYAISMPYSLTTGQTVTLNNSIIINTRYPLNATTLGDLVEDYNAFYGSVTVRTNVNVGASSNIYPAIVKAPPLISGHSIPWLFVNPSQYSQVRAITGSSQPSEDFFGISRPTLAAKKSWGPVQYQPVSRSTTQVYGSSTASLKLADAGRTQMRLPTTGVQITVSVRVYRETNYDAGSGTLPKMVIKQDGQSDRTTTDAGSATSWNELTDTFTPAATPGWIVVELVSDNAATSGSYAVYFDALTVT